MAHPGCRILHVAEGRRRDEMAFSRFLRNPRVTPAALSAGAAARTAARVEGRDVLAIQDTSAIILGGKKVRMQGFGPVGKGGALGGVFLHAVLAVDAASRDLPGLADAALWNRTGGRRVVETRRRGRAERESQRWMAGAARAGEVLSQARRITVVCDREGDIFEDFACRPANVHLLTRSLHDRAIETDPGGGKLLLSKYINGLPEVARYTVAVPAVPGRAARVATVALRHGPASVKAPADIVASEPESLPAHVALHVVDAVEIDAPAGVAPLHWRLLTTRAVADAAAAREIVRLYRLRWIVEEYFRTLKTAGFRIEEAEIGKPGAMMNFAAMAAIAAVAVTQLVRARDNPGGQSLLDAFGEDDIPVLEAVAAKYEGPAPTKRQTNPHAKGTMAYATWVVARLGGWTGYYGKPGPKTLNRGMERYKAIKQGFDLKEGIV